MNKILEIENVTKKFEEKTVHRSVSFHLNEGETLGLLGHSGTGKSVLLRSLIGLEEIDSGRILYRGQRIDDLTEEELYPIRTRISYSFQNGALFDSYSVFENIAYPLMAHRKLMEEELEKKIRDILRVVNMEDSIDLMPSDLSGGMQKRVGLARSIALEPDIILYDEPTAGLDPVNVDMVLDLMRKFKKNGCSSILVTHDMPAARKICDRFLILKDGVIHFDGNLEAFEKSQDKFVQTFWAEK